MASENREKRQYVYLSDSEKKRIQDAADAVGIPAAVWSRMKLLEAAREAKNDQRPPRQARQQQKG